MNGNERNMEPKPKRNASEMPNGIPEDLARIEKRLAEDTTMPSDALRKRVLGAVHLELAARSEESELDAGVELPARIQNGHNDFWRFAAGLATVFFLLANAGISGLSFAPVNKYNYLCLDNTRIVDVADQLERLDPGLSQDEIYCQRLMLYVSRKGITSAIPLWDFRIHPTQSKRLGGEY
jgi:hypothetical protein